MASEESEMLEELGIKSVEELFSDIPNDVRTGPLNIEKGLPEKDVRRNVMEILGKNRTACEMPSFLGAGVYYHYIPAAVFELISRSEFYSSYTPYQPEISQGMLQALFEYQSFVCELTGMDAANSSMYDASTALAEAALMSVRISGNKNVVVPSSIHWEKKSVLGNYSKGPGLHVEEVRYDATTGMVDVSDLKSKVDGETSAVYVESPNLFGVFANIAEIKEKLGEVLLLVGANPLSLAVAEAPGNLGADIVVGEGQILGNPMNFGGPLIGIFACRKEHIRKMPGRVIGATNDVHGRRAFTMALQTREQHIRREKATSNICTNESLGSVAFAIHVAILGSSPRRSSAAPISMSSLSGPKRTMKRFMSTCTGRGSKADCRFPATSQSSRTVPCSAPPRCTPRRTGMPSSKHWRDSVELPAGALRRTTCPGDEGYPG
jgi:glycine dehydrogenase subunit 1